MNKEHKKIDEVLNRAFRRFEGFNFTFTETDDSDGEAVDWLVSVQWDNSKEDVAIVLREYYDQEKPVELLKRDDFEEFDTEDLPIYCLILLLEDDE